MASDLSSGCTETIDILDEKEEGEISLEDVSSSEEGGIGHLTCGYVVRTRRSCPVCKSTWRECASWCTASSKMHYSKSQSRRDPLKGKENRHHVNEAGCTTLKHALSTLQEKNDDLVPISSDSDMEIVGLTDTSKQLVTRSKVKVKKKKKKKKEYEYLTVDDLISPASADLPITECFSALKSSSRETSVKEITINRTRYRKSSPVHRSSRTRVITRSPLRRHRSPVGVRPTFHGSSRSPLERPRSPGKRSPRRLKSPKRSNSLHSVSPVRGTSRKHTTRLNTSPPPSSSSSATYFNDRHGDVTRLLKKVKRLDSVGARTPESSVRRNKEHQPASLKEKLCNMMKKTPKIANDHIANSFMKKSSLAVGNDFDEEDDLALLRQKALDTKQKNKLSRSKQPTKTDSETKTALTAKVTMAAKATMAAKINDDQDEEALELRMIALRSAVMKKHQNRVQRGVRAKNKKKTTANRSESPFTQSFLENIPVPNEELLQFASPPPTPVLLSADSNHVEDMELDTDVEREKEKLPYSPTDKITTDIPIDTELLGIEPSDVSFINLNNSSIFATSNERRPPQPADGVASALDDIYLSYYAPSPNHFVISPLSNSDESFHMEPSDNQKELPGYLRTLQRDCIDCDLIDGTCCQQTFDDTNNKCSYPIASMYPEVDVTAQDLPMIDLPASSVLPDRLHVSPQMQSIVEQPTDNDLLVNLVSTYTEQQSVGEQRGNEHAYNMALGYPLVNVSTVSTLGTPTLLNSDGVSTITVHNSREPENHQAFPAANGDRDLLASDTDYNANDAAMYCQADATREPSYMQGVPDITKDANKIPTLINKTLVPVPVLKSNKQLQQPLPPSSSSSSSTKQEEHTEPTFKSAEMRPVIVITSANSPRSGTVFKPIKLVPFPKKRQRVLTAPVVFKESTNKSSEKRKKDVSKSGTFKSDGSEATRQTEPTVVTKSDVSSTKKRKRAKKNSRVNSHVAELMTEKKNGSCTNNDINKNVNITTTVPPSVPRRSSTESMSKKKNNDDDKARESGKSISSQNTVESTSPTLPADLNDKDIRAENADNVEKNDQQTEELKNHTTSSIGNKCLQEKSTESHCSSANFDTAKNKVAGVTKDANRRASMDEDENELRAILLASLTKRTTKSDSNVSSATSVVTNECSTTSNQASTQKVSANTEPVTTANETASNPSLGGVKKRFNATTVGIRGPPKKMLRKAPVPASTKVVNNAKKYQNTIVQRKLNPQKLEVNVLNKSKVKQLIPPTHQDNVWSAANGPTKKSSMAYASETQRIVINLESDSDSETELEKGSNVKTLPVITSVVNVNTQEPNTDFEKSLHKFLRDVRKEHETATATSPSSSSSKPVSSPQTARRDTPTPVTQADAEKDSSNMHTPLTSRGHLEDIEYPQDVLRTYNGHPLDSCAIKAVRHLSASKQEEYRRLKQQILEREKLKEQRKVVNKSNDGSVSNKVSKNISSTSAKQNQTESKELEKGSQQPAIEFKTKMVDVAKSTTVLNTSLTSKNISNITKQINSMQPKTTKKMIPNLSIRITNEIAPARATIEGKTVENSVEFVNKYQPMSDKLQFRPALRTLSRDEINRKYVQVQLNQDTTERVVTINDKTSDSWHDATNTSHSDEPVENSNAVIENLDEKTVNKSDDRVNDSNFSNATTVLISNTSKQELVDSMETTISRSQYEREREMNRNVSASSLPAGNCCNEGNDTSSRSNASTDDVANMEDIWNTLKRDTKMELESYACIPKMEQQRHLSDVENKLVARRYTVLDHLADMSGNLRQWDMEKELQNSLAIEVKKLKEQLMIAEERLEEQRNRVSSMVPKISMARQKINIGRRECFKLSRTCTTLGNRFIGKNYKLPEAGDQLLSEKLKEIVSHIRQLSKKKLLSNDASENFILPSLSLSESSKVALEAIEDVSLQTLPTIDAVSDVLSLQDDASSRLARCNDNENSSTIDILQTLPNEVTPTKKNQISMVVSKSHSDEDTPTQDRLLSEPKLSSTPISVKQNNECTQRTRRVDVPVSSTSPERGPSPVDYSLHPDSEQRVKKRTQSPMQSPMTTATTTTTITTITTPTTTTKTTSSTMMNTATTTMTTTTTTTATTTTTTTTTIKPYVSILTHLKTPRNVNPNGILCPYDLMGICNDGDCQFIHQSTSST